MGWVVVVVVGVAVGLGGPVVLRERASARYPVTAADLAAGRSALAALAGPDQRPAAADGSAVPDGSGVADGSSYEREQFGTAWADVDRNGCDTRNDVLRRDLTATTIDADGCTVLTGVLADPYTGRRIVFARGKGSALVQIDHVVALAAAWSSGAASWDRRTREAFANDPANLLAVDGPANQDKGASDAAAWLPPDPGFACVYALRQIRVKAAYGLSVADDERAALDDALDTCVTA
ncbi:MAG: HNH endonuclease family protein [Cellulomonas sp.]|uniref:HNH endonuclease family protein n=2 Tax=unclassified Cellulomonas TaxID=2620175 RepID=UPI002585474C|nr:HNH endonuclease family protein [Cellulomonas sp.]MCR6705260.1 HNH endonuclease family protein [Cellulomonas sp.]